MFIAEILAITPLHSVAIAWKNVIIVKPTDLTAGSLKKENKHDASL